MRHSVKFNLLTNYISNRITSNVLICNQSLQSKLVHFIIALITSVLMNLAKINKIELDFLTTILFNKVFYLHHLTQDQIFHPSIESLTLCFSQVFLQCRLESLVRIKDKLSFATNIYINLLRPCMQETLTWKSRRRTS